MNFAIIFVLYLAYSTVNYTDFLFITNCQSNKILEWTFDSATCSIYGAAMSARQLSYNKCFSH